MKKFYYRSKTVIKPWLKRIEEDGVTVYAAQAAFFIITAFVPFIMLVTTLLKFFVSATEGEMKATVVALFPQSLKAFVLNIVEEIYGKTPASFLSLAAAAALWSSSRGLSAVRRGLNRVFRLQEKRGYVGSRLMAIFYTLVFVFFMIFSLALLVFGSSIGVFLSEKYGLAAWLMEWAVRLRGVISLLVLTLVFASAYRFLPAHKPKFSAQLPGAFSAALGWSIFSSLYSLYIEKFSRHSYVYGSLGAIVFLMFWVYFCFVLLFLGAEVNEFLDEHIVKPIP